MLPLRMRLPLRVSRSLTISRLYATPSRPSFAPQAALKESEDDHPVYENPQATTPNRTLTGRSPYDGSARQMVSLPPMLPPDAAQEHPEQNVLYPSTGVIDSTSMIGICLRRREHIPRGYHIFLQLLKDYVAKKRPAPHAEIFGQLCEGILANLAVKGSLGAKQWASRAEHIVGTWEEIHGAPRRHAVKRLSGIKVYRSWFSGLIRSENDLLPLVPYLQNGSLTVPELLGGVRSQDMDKAFAALRSLAHQTQMSSLEEAIKDAQTREKEALERASRQVAPELRPIGAHEGSSRAAALLNVEEGTERFNISNLRRALAPLGAAASAHERQLQLEDTALEAARLELEHSAKRMAERREGNPQQLAQSQLQAWMHEWLQALQEYLKKDIAEMQSRVDSQRKTNVASGEEEAPLPEEDIKQYIGSATGHKKVKEGVLSMYLSVVSPEKLALITILELMRCVGTTGIIDGMKAVRGMLCVGKGVELEYQAETIKELSGTASKQWQNVLDPQTQQPQAKNISTVWNKIGKGLEDDTLKQTDVDWSAVWTPSWTQAAHMDLGSYLVDACIKVAKVRRSAVDPKTGEEVTEEQPAWAHTYEYVKGNKLGVLRLNPAVASRMSFDRLPSIISPKYLPMLVKPEPWTAYDIGGYKKHRTPIMRAKESPEQAMNMKAAIEEKKSEAILHGLDVLSSTSWQINRRVYDVMTTCWNRGEGIADIPASEANSSYDWPEKPSAEQSDPRARTEYMQNYKLVLVQQKKDHGERCKINYTLEVARAFLNDVFYLPHNMDFRGRCYPIPPHLSPVGDDLNRGLLLFGEGRALGKTGLRWLQIHLANVYGYDKLSFDERARFAEDHVNEVFDSADNPLEGKRWWLQAEDPWQCLATCFELAAALRSSDPSQYVSHFPVHQDGTCNGMQHYAALGGDVRGARAVNLENGDRPADIYTRVVEVANKVVEGDKQAGHEIAALIKEPLTRKVVKQTVMTTVYGVTYVGARDQIARQLVNRTDIESRHVFAVSGYLAKTILSCIGDLFSGAKDIQDWLVVAARLISRSIPADRVQKAVEAIQSSAKSAVGGGRTAKTHAHPIARELMTSVQWTSPLGLPVVQPYRKPVKKQVMTALQSVYVSDPHQPSQVATAKQATAFPPNFVHSLDATHMFITALECKRAHVTFASVHDSYWTHAATVDDMSALIRESFIKLHSAEIINELRVEFLDRFGDYLIPIQSARVIKESVTKKQEKEEQRRAQVRRAIGAEIDSTLNLGSDDPSPASLAAAEAEVMGEPAEEMGGLGSSFETDLEESSESKSDEQSTTFSESDIAQLRGTKSGELEGLEVHQVSNFKFIKLKDLLPPPPVKGNFDVQKIRDSMYFFS